MSTTIQILIIEDNPAFAESLMTMIEISHNMSCSAVYGSAEKCMTALTSTAPPVADLVLLDLHLPGKNGLTLVPMLRKFLPDADILVLTQDDDYLTTLEAIRLGVAGYILKDSSITEIRDAIQDIHDGAGIIDPQLSRMIFNALSSDKLPVKNPLNSGELEVLELLAMGYIKKEIAERLNLSYRSVSKKTERIYKKMQVPNVAAAVAAAIRKGLI
ncbi:response regulator transcription factor [Pontiella agarivorans]|uniref:Response regulator transcription factor n=1 Tax=Pontiella agarivorans TaxID=3038953 RepID=A0ABU5MS65_9BACT|nr:response regulator transcription factor [Pontiella agarivorans]MDZ8117036.1 response regulator transcription factor [Pontiella agarivorans]